MCAWIPLLICWWYLKWLLSTHFTHINAIEKFLGQVICARKNERESTQLQAATEEIELQAINTINLKNVMDNNNEKNVRNIHHCDPNAPTDHKAFYAIKTLTDVEFMRKSSMLKAHMLFLQQFINRTFKKEEEEDEKELEDDIKEDLENGNLLSHCLYFEQLYDKYYIAPNGPAEQKTKFIVDCVDNMLFNNTNHKKNINICFPYDIIKIIVFEYLDSKHDKRLIGLQYYVENFYLIPQSKFANKILNVLKYSALFFLFYQFLLLLLSLMVYFVHSDDNYIVENTIFWSYARWWTTFIIGTGSFAPRPMFFCLVYFMFYEIHANRCKYVRQLLFSNYNKEKKVKTDLNFDRKYLNSDHDITSIVSNFSQLFTLVKIYFIFVCAMYLFALPFTVFTFLVPLSLFIIFVILHGVYFCVREPHECKSVCISDSGDCVFDLFVEKEAKLFIGGFITCCYKCDYETKDASCSRLFNESFMFGVVLCYLQMTYFMGIDLFAGFSLNEAMGNSFVGNNQCEDNSLFKNYQTDGWFERIICFGSTWEWLVCLGCTVLIVGYHCKQVR